MRDLRDPEKVGKMLLSAAVTYRRQDRDGTLAEVADFYRSALETVPRHEGHNRP